MGCLRCWTVTPADPPPQAGPLLLANVSFLPAEDAADCRRSRWCRRVGVARENGTVADRGCAGDEVFKVACAAVTPVLIAEVPVEGMGFGAAARAGDLHGDA